VRQVKNVSVMIGILASRLVIGVLGLSLLSISYAMGSDHLPSLFSDHSLVKCASILKVLGADDSDASITKSITTLRIMADDLSRLGRQKESDKIMKNLEQEKIFAAGAVIGQGETEKFVDSLEQTQASLELDIERKVPSPLYPLVYGASLTGLITMPSYIFEAARHGVTSPEAVLLSFLVMLSVPVGDTVFLRHINSPFEKYGKIARALKTVSSTDRKMNFNIRQSITLPRILVRDLQKRDYSGFATRTNHFIRQGRSPWLTRIFFNSMKGSLYEGYAPQKLEQINYWLTMVNAELQIFTDNLNGQPRVVALLVEK
jgi:hypothetical protein